MDLLFITLIKIFRNYIPSKKTKFKYGEEPWINKNMMKSTLPKRSKLTKRYYVNDQVQSDYNLLLSQSEKCTEMILSAKNDYLLRMYKKLSDPSTALKSYWSILNRFFNNK